MAEETPRRSIEELGRILRDMYDSAQYGEKSAMILIFGIQYAEAIGKRAGDIVALADIGDGNSYATEVYKGMRLRSVLTRYDDQTLLQLIRGETG